MYKLAVFFGRSSNIFWVARTDFFFYGVTVILTNSYEAEYVVEPPLLVCSCRRIFESSPTYCPAFCVIVTLRVVSNMPIEEVDREVQDWVTILNAWRINVVAERLERARKLKAMLVGVRVWMPFVVNWILDVRAEPLVVLFIIRYRLSSDTRLLTEPET